MAPRRTPLSALGPKAGFYRSLAREQWGPVMKRTEVRQAMFWVIGGGALVAGGFVGLMFTGEALTPIVVGLIAMASAWGLWKEHRPLFHAWRRIGDVTLVGPPPDILPGDVATLRLEVAPRRAGELSVVTLTFSWRDSRSGPAGTAWAVDAELPDPLLRPGARHEFVAEVCLPPGVPPSRFEPGWTRQWSCTARLELTDGRTWERSYPVFVLP